MPSVRLARCLAGQSILAITFLAHMAGANAAEWSQQVAVPASLEYDTNPAMRPDPEGGVWRARASPSYSTVLRSSVDEFTATFGLLAERPSDETRSRQRDDKSASAGWKHAFERGSVQANLSTSESSTRTTELEESGLVTADSTRTQSILSVSANRELEAGTRFNFSGSGTRARYDTPLLIGFDKLTAQTGLNHQYSERIGTFAQLSQTSFSPETGPGRRTSAVTFGASLQQTERLKWSGQLGARRTVGPSTGKGIDGHAAVNWVREVDEFSATLARAQTDSSTGKPVITDRVNIAWRRSHGDNQTSGLEGSLSSVRDASGALIAQASAWHSRDISASLQLRLFLQKKRVSREGFDTANATIAGATLGYTWHRTN